jgi:hypothetical protein
MTQGIYSHIDILSLTGKETKRKKSIQTAWENKNNHKWTAAGEGEGRFNKYVLNGVLLDLVTEVIWFHWKAQYNLTLSHSIVVSL